MDVRVRGDASPAPFLSARDLLATEHTLSLPAEVQVSDDPDERTRVVHREDRHVLHVSRQVAASAMARELALHEFAHMVRHEQGHPSHVQDTGEALFLALSGRSVERRKVVHCYQIANHMKDVYADDITLSVGPADKLVAFLEAELADALADRPTDPFGAVPDRSPNPPGTSMPDGGTHGRRSDRARDRRGPSTVAGAAGDRRSHPVRAGTADGSPDPVRASATADPELTAVNAAFALALVERHGLVSDDHRLYDLAHAAARDAPHVALETFKRQFRSLAPDTDEATYRKALVGVAREYCGDDARAAD